MFINDAGRNLLRIPTTLNIRETFTTDYCDQKSAAKMANVVLKCVAAGSTWQGELILTRFDDQTGIPVLARIFPVCRSDGKPFAYGTVTADLRPLKRSEDLLRESEAKFQAIANSIDQMVWSCRPDGFHDYFNARWYEYTGAEPGATNGSGWQQYFHPADKAETLKIWQRCLDTGAPYRVEYRLKHRSGAYRWVLGRAQCARDAQSNIFRWFGTCTDIQELVEARELLAQAHEGLAHSVVAKTVERDRLWRLSRDPFLIMDREGRWISASPAWTDILGWSEEDLTGRTSDWILHPEDLEATRAKRQVMAKGTFTSRSETRLRTKAGNYRWFSWTAVPEGDLIYVVARDVTIEKEQGEALKAAEGALLQSFKMDAMGQLTGGVAHDFNNLLTPILGSLDMLQRKGVGTDREQRLISGALQSAERAKTLVQRLLAFARRQPLQPVSVDLAKLVKDMFELICATLGPQINCVSQIPDQIPPAKADPNQLEMALLNLAVNARDAMPDGGMLKISVERIRLTRQDSSLAPGEYLRLTMEDDGVGMDEATLARAVEPFFSTKGLGKGTGLGLSMAHGLAAQLGGELRINSALGQGARVELWLPRSYIPVSGPATDRLPIRMDLATKGAVLLVDDEDAVRGATAHMLAGLGFTVVEASSSEHALSLIQQGLDFDLLVTDHLMAGRTGTELATEVRAARPETPILIISGYSEVEGIAQDLPRLAKPFRQADLEGALQAILQ
jgi:PAS domain S-box-containing protein